MIGGIASAQGIALFGDARLGLGYNINNDGGVDLQRQSDGTLDVPDDLRAVSRVRFGVNMTGETDSGITFGATIRADNSQNGQGGTNGQRAGSVFVSGSFGTLTFGDTNGADEQWVGDVPGNYSLTGLTDINETKYISNGGDFGNDTGSTFAENPLARPTVRYDFDIAGFGISLSSNRDLSDIGVGAGYAADFGGGAWSVGAGYYKFDSFVTTGEGQLEVIEDADGNLIVVPGAPIENTIPDGEQWSVGLSGDY
jgi:outer membrane protein OmpU